MEMITCAKNLLAVIIVEGRHNLYAKTKEYFQQAAEQGLIEGVKS